MFGDVHLYDMEHFSVAELSYVIKLSLYLCTKFVNSNGDCAEDNFSLAQVDGRSTNYIPSGRSIVSASFG